MTNLTVSFLVQSQALDAEIFSAHPEQYATYEEARAASDAPLAQGRAVLVVKEEWSGLNRSVRYAGGHRVP